VDSGVVELSFRQACAWELANRQTQKASAFDIVTDEDDIAARVLSERDRWHAA
jgi:hypothetical protein